MMMQLSSDPNKEVVFSQFMLYVAMLTSFCKRMFDSMEYQQ